MNPGWRVNGVPYAHSAAQFWCRLVAEAMERYPDCTEIVLSAPGEGLLDCSLLDPLRQVEEGMERMANLDPAEERRRILMQMAWEGAPAGVHLRVYTQGGEIAEPDLNVDYLDAEIFPCVVAWMLEWGGILPLQWNNETVAGVLEAEGQGRCWQLGFRLENRPISEGLILRSLAVHEIVQLPPRSWA